MSAPYPYPYPTPNPTLIKSLHLLEHFEGGYFAQTVSLESTPSSGPGIAGPGLPPSKVLEGRVQSAWGKGADIVSDIDGTSTKEKQGGEVVEATQIYYLLTAEKYRGRMHFNLHPHFHCLHAGRSLYTLIKPPTTPGELPQIRRVIMGPHIDQGEVMQLYVPGGWWKASEIPEEDLLLLDAPGDGAPSKDRIGCLVSEIVVPGWNPDQHMFLDTDKLKEMWGGKGGWEQYEKYTKAPEGLSYPDK